MNEEQAAQEPQQEAPAVETTEAAASPLQDILKKNPKVGAVAKDIKQDEGVVGDALAVLMEEFKRDANLVPDDTMHVIESLLSRIDKVLEAQVNEILHHPDFQKLESAWRGLHYLVNNSETGPQLQIRVMNVQKDELRKMFTRYPGTRFDQSPLFKRIYEDEFGTPGGKPYGALIGDYEFDHTAPDMTVLEGMSKIAAAAHAPFLAAAGPTVMNFESWQELPKPVDITKKMMDPSYARWHSFRDSEDSRYVGLCMPRFLGREPWGPTTRIADGFETFEEDCEGTDHTRYLWCNAAYAMAARLTDAFANYGWTCQIRGHNSGGRVEGLPLHTFPTDDGGVDQKCPTEVAITDRREKELADNGFIPLSHYKNTDYAVFFGAQSAQKPASFDNPDDTAKAQLAARLPYMFACCRFAHYLKCMVRDQVGELTSKEEMRKSLNNWIMNYVEPDESADQVRKAKRPLAAAEVIVQDVEGNPGYYDAKFVLVPHYQLEGVNIKMTLSSKLGD